MHMCAWLCAKHLTCVAEHSHQVSLLGRHRSLYPIPTDKRKTETSCNISGIVLSPAVKTAQRSLKMLKIELPYDPKTLLLCIHPKKTKTLGCRGTTEEERVKGLLGGVRRGPEMEEFL